MQGKPEEALSVWHTVSEGFKPSVVASHRAWALADLGRTAEAGEVISGALREEPSDPGGLLTGMQALLSALRGDRTSAESAIHRASKARAKDVGTFHHTAYWIACAYARMNAAEKAVQWLEETVNTGFPCYPLFLRDPNLNSLRKDPQFMTFMEQLRRQWEFYNSTL